MIRTYVAASWSAREAAHDAKERLQEQGFWVTSRWIDGHDEFKDAHHAYALEDLQDIDFADAVLVFTDVPSSTGGFHVEFGYALAKEKPIILIGPRTNLFHHLVQVQRYDTLDDFLKDKCQ